MSAGAFRRTSRLVVLDTSALMALYDRIPVFELIEEAIGAYRCVVPSCVKDELLKHARGPSIRKAKAALLALELVSNRCVETACPSRSPVDDAVIAVAKEMSALLATMDLEMARRARRSGVPVLVYRSSKRRFISFVEV